MSSNEKIKVTLIKSPNGRLKTHKGCILGLGLRRIGSSSVLDRTPSVLGMVNKIQYLLKVE
jgi:large subunit ribosomal protein L30